MKALKITLKILLILLVFVSSVLLFSALCYSRVFGKGVGFSAVIYTLTAGVGTAEGGLIWKYILGAVLPSLLVASVCAVLLFKGKDLTVWIIGKIKLLIKKLSKKSDEAADHPEENERKTASSKLPAIILAVLIVLMIGMSCLFVYRAAVIMRFPEYIKQIGTKGTLYEENYVDPKSANITFPEKKRNLIYILCESMETSFFSKDHYGAFDTEVIPELYELAKNNINFSDNDSVGGWPYVKNTEWTIASIIAQTSGVPYLSDSARNYSNYKNFLPGLTTIQSVLRENGYYQTMMVGSDGNFAGRNKYYLQHGADVFYDLKSAEDAKIIPEGYHVWWGMEDLHLFEFAKQELLEISKKDRPFAFSLLTVDTHHVNGYKCELCGDEFEEQYENVYACSSKQVTEFVKWIMEQDFYENTTIVVCGDHLSMDQQFFSRNVAPDYERHVFNCIINSLATTDNTKNRVFAPMDMFPTTLAAIGCKIEGERLGLGTNLFSDVPTLSEKFGKDEYNNELGKYSEYYNKNFIGDLELEAK